MRIDRDRSVTVLVTGAAGYIGSVVTDQLLGRGYGVVALDNLHHGSRAAVHPDGVFEYADLLDPPALERVFQRHRIDAVVHMAAEALIDESVRDPGKFYRVNVQGGSNLLLAMAEHDVSRMIFSSTAAVYGDHTEVPIEEDAYKEPVNAYGDSKLAFERMLYWYHRAYGLKFITFRYFNACGATERRGEFHQPETHLIPIVCQAALGLRQSVHIYGTDYPTPDGTCVRDYVHVDDIARAHILGLEQIDRLEARYFNLGNEAGYSNCEVVDAVSRVSGRQVQVVPEERRTGDPARLVASSVRVRELLGWLPRIPDLESMARSAWEWHRSHPHGYEP